MEDTKWLKQQLVGYEIIIHATFISLSLVAKHDRINRASLAVLKKAVEQSKTLDAKVIK